MAIQLKVQGTDNDNTLSCRSGLSANSTSYSYNIFAYYVRTGINAKIVVYVKTAASVLGPTISNATYHVTVDGETKTQTGVTFQFKPYLNEVAATLEFNVTYNTDLGNGKIGWGTNSSPKTIGFWVTGGSGEYEGSTINGNSVATSSNPATASVYLAGINALPTVSVSQLTYVSGTDFHGVAVAGYTKIKESLTWTKGKVVTGYYKAAGQLSQHVYRNQTTEASGTNVSHDYSGFLMNF